MTLTVPQTMQTVAVQLMPILWSTCFPRQSAKFPVRMVHEEFGVVFDSQLCQTPRCEPLQNLIQAVYYNIIYEKNNVNHPSCVDYRTFRNRFFHVDCKSSVKTNSNSNIYIIKYIIYGHLFPVKPTFLSSLVFFFSFVLGFFDLLSDLC